LFEHGDAALAVRARFGDARVDRERAEERQQDEHQRRERRQQTCCKKRDTGLIAERREVIDARETHDLPPRRLVLGACDRASVAARITSAARGTPATPLLVSIKINSIVICCPIVSSMFAAWATKTAVSER